MAMELSEAVGQVLHQAVEVMKQFGMGLTKDDERLDIYVKACEPASIEEKTTVSIGWKFRFNGNWYGSYIVVDREELKV